MEKEMSIEFLEEIDGYVSYLISLGRVSKNDDLNINIDDIYIINKKDNKKVFFDPYAISKNVIVNGEFKDIKYIIDVKKEFQSYNIVIKGKIFNLGEINESIYK